MLLNSEEITRILQRFHICAPIFIALGDEARQKLVLDIADAGKQGLNVTDLSSRSNLSRPAISHHLKVLKDAGLIYPDKQGTQIFYKLKLTENLKIIENLTSSIHEVINKIENADNQQTECL